MDDLNKRLGNLLLRDVTFNKCVEAILKLQCMDIITDDEYHAIMSKLIEHEGDWK